MLQHAARRDVLAQSRRAKPIQSHIVKRELHDAGGGLSGEAVALVLTSDGMAQNAEPLVGRPRVGPGCG
jgi:hypothetical protein